MQRPLSSPVPAAIVSFALLAALTFAAENHLRNGDFEAGGSTSANDWETIYPRQLGAAEFSIATDSPRGGKRAGRLRVDFQGGYSSFSQTIAVSGHDRSLRFEAWARIDEPRAGAASLGLWFTIPGHADGGEFRSSRTVSDATEWTRLVLDAAIPDGATELIARLGVSGPCAASFDDATLTFSKQEIHPARLVVGHGDYRVARRGKNAAASVSIPFPLGGQTPLAIRVSSDPKGAVTALDIEKDRENRPLKLVLDGLEPGQSATLRVETLVLLRDRKLEDGAGVALTPKAKLGRDAKVFVAAAPGIDLDAPDVKRLAGTIDKRDFGSAMTSVARILRENLEYAGGGNQGAAECLASKKAVCTGYANVAASLLLAAGIPARILACTTIGSRLQEHYVIEAWNEKLGWCRMESTAARFPWRDSENLILRIVYPDAERSPFDVPLFKRASSDAEVNFHVGDDTCWQGADEFESLVLDAPAVAEIVKAATGRFEAAVVKPAPGSSLAFLDAKDVATESGARVASIVAEWVAKR